MKTAISLPDDLFRMAETAARRLKMSRSQLYATAISEYLDRRKTGKVTDLLNKIYSEETAKLDPVLERAQSKSLESESW